MFYLASARVTRFTLVPLLALWIAGTGCLLGCERGAQAAHKTAREGAEVVSEEVCGSKNSHGCCHTQGSVKESSPAEKVLNPKAQVAYVPEDFGPMMGCPFATSRVAVMTKARDDASPFVLLMRPTPSQPLAVDKLNGFSASLLPRDRGHTYLRCCVFLI